MATTKDWSAQVAPTQLGLRFADGDASAWCIHTAPAWARQVTVYNDGTGALRVSYPRATSIAFVSTHDYMPLPAGASVGFAISRGAAQPTVLTFATFGADGATHAMRVTFEASP